MISTSKSIHIVQTLKSLTALSAGPECHADSLWRAREVLEEMEGRLGSASFPRVWEGSKAQRVGHNKRLQKHSTPPREQGLCLELARDSQQGSFQTVHKGQDCHFHDSNGSFCGAFVSFFSASSSNVSSLGTLTAANGLRRIASFGVCVRNGLVLARRSLFSQWQWGILQRPLAQLFHIKFYVSLLSLLFL